MLIPPGHILRFLSKVSIPNEDSACWEWTAAKFHHGHGVFRIFGKNVKAHRVSYMLKHGHIDGLVLHRCGNSSCVNPDHLYQGSHKENSRDRKSHGTSIDGEKNPHCKLTKEKVSEIRSLSERGISNLELSEKFGVHSTTISKIILNKIWKDD